VSTTPQPAGFLDKLILVIETATVGASLVPQASEYAQLALKFEQIAAAGIQMHEQLTGQPFDRSKLPVIEPVA
jgi:hypothetical protein